MNIFYYYWYESEAKKEKSRLEIAFDDLIKKIELYERQYKITLDFYKSEYSNDIKKLDEEFIIGQKERQKIYDKAFDEMEGEKYPVRDDYANHVSGLDTLHREFYKEKNDTKTRYKYFLDSYSKSLLVTLYSLTESKLKEICDIASVDFTKKLKYEHLDSRDYLKTSLNYFDLVIEIPINSLESYISKLKDIQFIRNRITHSESKFSKDNNISTIKEIVNKYNAAIELIKNESDVLLKIVKPEFIIDFIELIRELFEELLWLIDSRQEKKILRKGLEYWFGLLDENIFIKNIQLKKVAKGKRNIKFDLSSRKKNIPKFKCAISIGRSSKNSLELINQIDNEAINTFTELVNEIDFFLFDYVFELFNFSKRGIKIKVMMFD